MPLQSDMQPGHGPPWQLSTALILPGLGICCQGNTNETLHSIGNAAVGVTPIYGSFRSGNVDAFTNIFQCVSCPTMASSVPGNTHRSGQVLAVQTRHAKDRP